MITVYRLTNQQTYTQSIPLQMHYADKELKILINYQSLIMGLNYLSTLLCVVCLLCTLNAKLIFAFGVARHGAEFPRNDLYDGNQTKVDRGLITPIGLRQHYNLGTYFKQNYGVKEGLISVQYDPKNVQFFSTSYERTMRSSWTFINGLYPLGNGWKIPEQVTADKLMPPYKPLFPKKLQQNQIEQPFALTEGFTPVPVRNLDSILNYCPNYDSLIARRTQQISAYIEILQSEQRTQIAKLKDIFRLNASQQNVAVMCDLYQTLTADQYLGRPLPAQYNDSDKKNLKYLYQFSNSLLFDGNFARTLSTPLLRMVRSSLTKALQKQDLKFILAIGHKSNLYPLIVLLNLTSSQCLTEKWKGQTVTSINCVSPPEFAANIVFELHQDDTFQKFVSVKYNGQYVYLCDRQQYRCPFRQFSARLKALQNSFQSECGIAEQANVVEM